MTAHLAQTGSPAYSWLETGMNKPCSCATAVQCDSNLHLRTGRLLARARQRGKAKEQYEKRTVVVTGILQVVRQVLKRALLCDCRLGPEAQVCQHGKAPIPHLHMGAHAPTCNEYSW